jgi:hypothetical protein
MGQRLVIQISNDDKILANAYYHWDGFTKNSLDLAKKIIDQIKDVHYKINQELAISLLKDTGAELTQESQELLKLYKKNLYEIFEPYGEVSRNEELIEVFENGIKNSEYYAEAIVNIDLAQRDVQFCAFFNGFLNIERLKEYYDDYSQKETIISDAENVPEFDICYRYDHTVITRNRNGTNWISDYSGVKVEFQDFDKFYDYMYDLFKKDSYIAKLNGVYFSLIA